MGIVFERSIASVVRTQGVEGWREIGVSILSIQFVAEWGYAN